MKRLWVALLFLGVALVLFIGTPALSIGPTASALDGMQQSLDALQESMALDNQIRLLQASRFTDNGDGTVRDNLTVLVWTKNASIWVTDQTWSEACNKCNQLADGEGGLSDNSVAGDWRLPSLRELHSLVDYGKYNPPLPSGHPFVGVQSSAYWSSTTYANTTNYAWGVYFNDGKVFGSGKSASSFVWCVRGGP